MMSPEALGARDANAMVTFPGGEIWPSLGLGTWRMGESRARLGSEVAAVRAAIEMGYRVIDTAEMYGDGGAERVVGTAITESIRAGTVARDELLVVSKVSPQNASAKGTLAACERSRARLGLECIDVYLLHWPGAVPLAETVRAFETLRGAGRIRHWGVSNFDVDRMRELIAQEGGERCVTNQIYYSLTARGAGFDLVPWQQSHGIVTMAYSPIDQGDLARHAALRRLADESKVTAAQLALAWLAAQPGVLAIPKATSLSHLEENLDSLSIALVAEDQARLDRVFAPPTRKAPLDMR
jgi:diketogulonate reductase-like aldo/keto reductase